MSNIDRLRNFPQEVIHFIRNLSTGGNIANGQYELGNGVYVNVESYTSQKREDRQYENHRQYIDIQYVMEGEELIEVSPVGLLKETSAYDSVKDIAFYDNGVRGERHLLKKDQFLVLYPNQAHMPCIQAQGQCDIKKVVVKVPVKLLPRLLFMDVDGTLTDGKIYMGPEGELLKAFDVKDGYAVANILPQKNILPVVITGRGSTIVENRCKELGITEVYQNVSSKKEKMVEIANLYGIFADETGCLHGTAYIGDDMPDYECMVMTEKTGCPLDAVDKVREISDFISTKKGGEGAVREFIEWVCKDV